MIGSIILPRSIAVTLAGTILLGAALAQEAPRPPAIELTAEQRRALTRHITPGPQTSQPEEGVRELRPGVPVPRTTRLYPLPRGVADEVPGVRGYRYFVAEERLVLVDPEAGRIVEVVPIR